MSEKIKLKTLLYDGTTKVSRIGKYIVFWCCCCSYFLFRNELSTCVYAKILSECQNIATQNWQTGSFYPFLGNNNPNASLASHQPNA